MRISELMGVFLLGLAIAVLGNLFLYPMNLFVLLLGLVIMALSYFSPSEKTLRKADYYEQQGALCHQFIIEWTLVLLVVFFSLVGTLALSNDVTIRNGWFYQTLTSPWGVWEDLQFVALLLSSIIIVVGVVRFHHTFAYKISFLFPLFFALIFFYGAGEEVGWGMALFEKTIPITHEVVVSGHQPDTTILPLRLIGVDPNFFANGIIRGLVLIYAGVIPLFAYCFRSVNLIVELLSLPLPHAAFVPICLMGVAMDNPWVIKGLLGLAEFPPYYDMSEFRETLLYMTILGGAILAYKKWKLRSLSI